MQFAGRAGVAGLHNIALDFTVLWLLLRCEKQKKERKRAAATFNFGRGEDLKAA